MVLVQTAAGGVGTILVQWAVALGATVIGVVGSAAKQDHVRAAGAAHVVVQSEDVARFVAEVTDGAKANVAYDSVGKDTFEASLNSLRPFGTMVVFGAASGPSPAVEPELLNHKGCSSWPARGSFRTTPRATC